MAAMNPEETLRWISRLAQLDQLPVHALRTPDHHLHIQVGGQGLHSIISIQTWNGRIATGTGELLNQRDVAPYLRKNAPSRK